jgi:competence protein ComEC
VWPKLAGTVVTEPRESPRGAWFLVSVRSVDGVATRARGVVRVDALEQAPELGAGLAFAASARPLGGEDFDGYLRRLHAGVELSPTAALSQRSTPGRLVRATTVVRDRTRAAARARLDPGRASLLSGLVTGDTRGQPAGTGEQLRAAGLSHLVAVSGSNVALVLAGVVGVASALGVGLRGRVWVGLAALAWFALLVRWEPSVLRASAVATLVLVATLIGRGRDARHLLAVAVILLLLVDPLLAGQLGFGLSVLAAGGVLVVAPALAGWLPGPRPVRVLLAASVGAQLAVAPLLFAVEGAVPLGGLPANLVAVPAAAYASGVGVVVALLAQLSIPAAGALAVAAGPALSLVLGTGRLFAGAPQLHLGQLLSPAAGLFVVAMLVLRRFPRAGAVAIALAVVVALWPLVVPLRPVSGLRLTALDVGQGDALLVEAPREPRGANRGACSSTVDRTRSWLCAACACAASAGSMRSRLPMPTMTTAAGCRRCSTRSPSVRCSSDHSPSQSSPRRRRSWRPRRSRGGVACGSCPWRTATPSPSAALGSRCSAPRRVLRRATNRTRTRWSCESSTALGRCCSRATPSGRRRPACCAAPSG